jgi:hypothetical protein
LPENRARAVGAAREFIRRMIGEQLGSNGRIRSVRDIHNVLTSVDGLQGDVSYNLVEKVRGGKDGPNDRRPQWSPIMDAILALDVDPGSPLCDVQRTIRRFHRIADDPLNLTLSRLFGEDDYAPDFSTSLPGDYVVYRQVTNSELVFKAQLCISSIVPGGGDGLRFQLTRADGGVNHGRYAEGRIIDSHYGYSLIGSLYGPGGEHDTGLMVASIAKMRGPGVAKSLNEGQIRFATGLHCLLSDFTQPCSSKIVVVRNPHQELLAPVDPFESAESRQGKLELFFELQNGVGKLSFEDAISEMADLTDLDEATLSSALSNETARSDTLSYDAFL